MEKGIDTEIKSNFIIDYLKYQLIMSQYKGNIHETTSLNILSNNLLNRDFPWIIERSGKILNFLLIHGRGYREKKSILNQDENALGFICLRITQGVERCTNRMVGFYGPETALLEELVGLIR